MAEAMAQGDLVTEESGEEEQRTFETILKTSLDGFWLCDSEGRILDLNDSLCRMLGYTREELLTMRVAQVEARETPEQVAQHSASIIERGYDRFESILRRKDGAVIDIEVSVSYLEDVEGRFFAFIRDITERKAAELALRESEERFRIALQNSNIVVYNQDQDLRYTWIYNPQLGYTPEGIVGRTDAELLLPEDAAPLERMKRQVLESGSGLRETVRTTIAGEAYFYDLTVEPLLDASGEIAGVTGASRDITAKTRARKALQESEERYRLLAENASDVVWIADLELGLTYVSPSLERLCGYTAQEAMARGFEEMVAPESLVVAMSALAAGRAIEESKDRDPHRVRTLELELLRQDGSSVWTETRISYIRDPDGRPQAITGVTRDISGRWQVEQALRKQSHALGERVKELNCLYGMSRLRETDGITLEAILQGTADLIPAAWQYPQSTGARVILDGREYRTENFQEGACDQQTAGIVVHGHASGVVQVCYVDEVPERDEGPFLKEERNLLIAIAERLGRITEHMRAEEALRLTHDELELRVQERTAELERGHQRERVLNALLRLSMEDTSLDEQLVGALDEILSIAWLPVQPKGGVFLVVGDAPSKAAKLELRAQRGLDTALRGTCKYVDFGQCLCGKVAASGELLFAERIDHRHEIRYEGMEPHGHYCVPILSGDRSIGVMVLYLEEGHLRDAGNEEFLWAVARTLAGIIERKRVEEALRQSEGRLKELNEQLEDYGRKLEKKVAERTHEIEQRRQVAESLRDILAVLNSNRPLEEMLSHIVTEARRLLGSDTSAIYRLDGSDGAFEVQTVQGQYAELVAPLQFPADYRQTLQDGQPIAISDIAVVLQDRLTGGAEPFLEDLADDCPAMLAVPLIIHDEVYGGLVLYYSESRVFSGEEVDLAVAFADQVALAIENARLHRQAEEAAVLEERGRLARDLHDSVTQSLYSLTLLAEGWRRLAEAGRLDGTEDPLTELGEIAQQALKEMRLMVHELRPPALEKEGLLGALHHRLGAVEKRAGVEARLVAEAVVELPAPVEEGLYRIALEALNNALKHAAATSVTIHLRADDEWVELEVEDNGQGFDTETIDEIRGMGLVSMKERAVKMGGTLSMQSEPGGGTRVLVVVPRQGLPERTGD